jgi:hypothetical protein
MAYKIIFASSKDSEFNSTLEVCVNQKNELLVTIKGSGYEMISLEKEAAIKLAKEIRKQISLMGV